TAIDDKNVLPRVIADGCFKERRCKLDGKHHVHTVRCENDLARVGYCKDRSPVFEDLTETGVEDRHYSVLPNDLDRPALSIDPDRISKSGRKRHDRYKDAAAALLRLAPGPAQRAAIDHDRKKAARTRTFVGAAFLARIESQRGRAWQKCQNAD